MNKTIRDMSGEEVFELPSLSLDDVFEFRCKACGACCKNRDDLLLTAYDLFRISTNLGRTPTEVYERYCEVYLGRQSKFPIVRVVPVPPYAACPFLRNQKCIVHAKKPVVCRVYPLARMFVGEEVRYVFSGSSCKNTPAQVTVREWIGDVATEECLEAGRLWYNVLLFVNEFAKRVMVDMSAEDQNRIYDIIFSEIYLNYDISESFNTQLERNLSTIKIFCKENFDFDELDDESD